MSGCTHHIYKCVNGVFYCCICGARIDPPKLANTPTEAAQAATDAQEKKPRRTRKKAGDSQ